MGPMNWIGVVVAANLAAVVALVWYGPLFGSRFGAEGALLTRSGPGRSYVAVALVMLVAATMLGHAFARIGADTLAAKPWLYFMQSGGIAIAFVIPAILLIQARVVARPLLRWIDAGFWLVAYLVMGAVFWALA